MLREDLIQMWMNALNYDSLLCDILAGEQLITDRHTVVAT